VFNSHEKRNQENLHQNPNSKPDMVCLTLMRKEIEKICIETPTQNQTNSHEKEIEKICIKTPTQNQTWCV
jgi:hypothetical protein